MTVVGHKEPYSTASPHDRRRREVFLAGRGSPSRHRYPLGWLPAPRLTPPRSGLERSDFVPWPIADQSVCDGMSETGES